jgi:hypothetical protein
VVLTLQTCIDNSTIMCQNHWWLKLFFYLLDVRMSKVHVLSNKLAKMHITDWTIYSQMNIVDFKMQLVKGLVGRLMEYQPVEEEAEHASVHIQGGIWSWCAYCLLLSRTYCTLLSRTGGTKDLNA